MASARFNVSLSDVEFPIVDGNLVRNHWWMATPVRNKVPPGFLSSQILGFCLDSREYNLQQIAGVPPISQGEVVAFIATFWWALHSYLQLSVVEFGYFVSIVSLVDSIFQNCWHQQLVTSSSLLLTIKSISVSIHRHIFLNVIFKIS